MKRYFGLATALFLAAFVIQTAGAATIDYDVTNIGGSRWQYDYTITNNSDDYLYGFSIYFDWRYDNLNFEVGSVLWEELEPGLGKWQNDWMVIWGDPFDYNDGSLSALNLNAGLMPGGILEGLSVSFDWSGLDAPGSQLFELFNADFVSLNIFGDTTGDIPPVPEPQTFLLLGTGLLGLAAYYRRNRKQ